MDNTDLLTVVWTTNAFETSLMIKEYLAYKFTQREIDNFYKMLASFEVIIKVFPEMHPVINEITQSRRAILSKQLSVFYIYSAYQIEIISVLDNRMDNSKWP